MVQKIEVTTFDDTDPTRRADKTLYFTVSGTQYEIDLADDNAAKFTDALAPWVQAARKVTGRKPSTSTGLPRGEQAAKARERAAANKVIRDWAAANHIKIQDRGVIPHVVKMAREANNPKMAVGFYHPPTEQPAPAATPAEDAAPAYRAEPVPVG